MKKIVFIFSIALFGCLFLGASKVQAAPLGPTMYWFNDGADANWTTLTGNWWDDINHTQQSLGLPLSNTPVITLGTIGPDVDLDTWTAPVSINATATGITFTSAVGVPMEIEVTGDATFNGTSLNYRLVTGNVTFNNSSINGADITGNVTFNDSSINGDFGYGYVSGNAVFNDTSENALGSIVEGDACFAVTATNNGTVNGSITVCGADATAPSVDTFFPLDNSTGMSITANLSIIFDEAVDVETGNIVIYKASDDSIFETVDVASGNVTGTGTTTITINPTGTLAQQTAYYVQIDATAFDDAASNSYAGIADETTWNFTTVDLTSPTVSTLSPTDEATAVSLTANLVINFDEAVDVESGNIVIYKASDDSVFETIDVTGGLVTGTGTTTITINPTGTLAKQTAYYVQIAATAFDDAAGNSYAGIADETTWNFTTESAPSTSSGSTRRTTISKTVTICPVGDLFSALTGLPCTSWETAPAPACVITQTLRVGSRGEQVKCLQSTIFAVPALSIDGIFGPKTRAAVVEFQKSKNLVQDGIFGPISHAAWEE